MEAPGRTRFVWIANHDIGPVLIKCYDFYTIHQLIMNAKDVNRQPGLGLIGDAGRLYDPDTVMPTQNVTAACRQSNNKLYTFSIL